VCNTGGRAGVLYDSSRPSQVNIREKANTTIVTIVKGSPTAKQVEDEFTRILSGTWRWTARKIAENKFTMRFSTMQLIKDWGRFNPVKMRSVKAKLQIDLWNNSIGAKAVLQEAWFRVRGIPFDNRCKEILAYVGSLVGATSDVDELTLNRMDYVRIKIAA
jgi:queuine/archaeosine tRNA-ribosyltransferase